MNHILDEEKIRKNIQDFYKTLLHRDADFEGLKHYTACVMRNSLTMEEVYDDIKNSFEASESQNSKLVDNETVFPSKIFRAPAPDPRYK